MRITVAVAMLVLTGCAETVRIASSPPGATVYVNGNKIGKTPVTYSENRPSVPRPYTIEYRDRTVREGVIGVHRVRGRIVGMIFTAGIFAIFRGATVFAPEQIDIAMMFREDNADAEHFFRSGGGKITGQAFATTRGGDVKFAAGRIVGLHPDCEAIRRYYLDHGKLAAVDLPAGDLTRTTIADASGGFEFEGLAPGKYLLVTNVNWYIATGATWATVGNFTFVDTQLSLQGGPLIKSVTVTDSTPVKVVMAR